MKKCLLIFILGFAMITAPAQAEQARDLRLEAIMYDKEHPEESQAMINEAMHDIGDVIGNHRLKEIGPNYVRVEEVSSGENTRLEMNPPNAETEETKSKGWKMPFTEGGWNFNLPGILDFAHEAQARNEMKQISIACGVAASETALDENGKPIGNNISIEFLVHHDLLPEHFIDGGKSGYRFRIEGAPEGCEVYGDPMDPNSNMRHFFLDHDQKWHAQYKGPANSDSPPPV